MEGNRVISLQQNLNNQKIINPSSYYKKINVPAISGTQHTLTASNTQSTFNIPAGV